MIKGQGRFNRYINTKLSNRYFLKASQLVFAFKPETFKTGEQLKIRLFSLSGFPQFVEQAFSIFSFLRNVGTPTEWVIISDGSHSKDQIDFLHQFSFVRIKHWRDMLSPEYKDFAEKNECWQYKKFFSYANIPIADDSCIFLDSDVLFFKSFLNHFNKLETSKDWSISINRPHFDKEYEHDNSGEYVISAFFILNKNLNWKQGIDYLINRKQEQLKTEHFTEQTAIEIIFKEQKVGFLNQDSFYTEIHDLSHLFSMIKTDEIAIRHYPGIIRFRMWIDVKKSNYFI